VRFRFRRSARVICGEQLAPDGGAAAPLELRCCFVGAVPLDLLGGEIPATVGVTAPPAASLLLTAALRALSWADWRGCMAGVTRFSSSSARA
jgi:hypothetical protein